MGDLDEEERIEGGAVDLLALPEGWEMAVDDDGNYSYKHAESGRTQEDRPVSTECLGEYVRRNSGPSQVRRVEIPTVPECACQYVGVGTNVNAQYLCQTEDEHVCYN